MKKSNLWNRNLSCKIVAPYHFTFPYFYNPFTLIFPLRQQLVNPVKIKMNFIFYYQSRILLHFYRACSQMRDAKISHSTVTNQFI